MVDIPKLRPISIANPLGVIALFISLIYGICAALLGYSVADLVEYQVTIIIIFVVLFPCVILAVFSWLVSNHHTKLYGPKDYKSDQAFLDARSIANPVPIGERIAEDIKADVLTNEGVAERSEEDNGASGFLDLAVEFSKDVSDTDLPVDFDAQKADGYIVENLILHDLQKELDGSVLREVGINLNDGRLMMFDGMIRYGSKVKFVEIKNVKSAPYVRFVLRKFFDRSEYFFRTFNNEHRPSVELLLVIVVDDRRNEYDQVVARVDAFQRENDCKFEVRLERFTSLLLKNGFKPVSR